jgi:uncharacterized protein involved in outer membrane biogenesis
MKKILKYALLAVLLLVVLAVAAISFYGGSIAKSAINSAGPKLLGVDVRVADVGFRPFAGRFVLKNMHVGNPEGFKTPYLFEVGVVDVDVDMASLFSDPVVVKSITIEAPRISYEQGLTGTNFGALLEQLEAEEKAVDDEAVEEEEAVAPAKKVVIDYLAVLDPQLNVSVKAAGGRYIPVKLGKVELEGIGRDGGGVGAVDAVRIFLSVITSNIRNAVAGAGDLIGAGVGAAMDGARAVTGAATEGAKAATGAAVDGAKAVGGAAADGARAGGRAVKDGASSVIKGVGGIFGRGGDEPDEEVREESAE